MKTFLLLLFVFLAACGDPNYQEQPQGKVMVDRIVVFDDISTAVVPAR